MAIGVDGFLSPEIENWAKVHRARNAEWRLLVQDINAVAYKVLPVILKIPEGEPGWKFLSRTLFLKVLESYQAAIILIDRGLTGDARNILRSAFENLFCLGASKDDGVVEKLIAADLAYKKKMARGLLELPGDLELDAPGKEKMQRYLRDNPERGSDTNVWELAKDAGLEEVYKVYYRSLSHEATHTSIISLDRHVVANPDGTVAGLRMGPDVKDVELLLATSCVVGFYLLRMILDKFPLPDRGSEVDALWDLYKALLEKTYRKGDEIIIPKL